MKLVKKCLVVFLSASLLLPIGTKSMSADELVCKETIEFEGTDGDSYLALVETNGNWDNFKYRITMENKENGDKRVVSYAEENLVTKEYRYTGKNWWGSKDYKLEDMQKLDCTEMIERAKEDVQAQGYRKKVEMLIMGANGYKYWYAVGNTGSDVGYTKIGNYNTYRIRDGKTTYLDSYMNKVNESNTYCAGMGIELSIAVIAAIGLIAFGPLLAKAAGITALGALGFTGAGALALWNACTSARQAGEYYDKAKACGTKL